MASTPPMPEQIAVGPFAYTINTDRTAHLEVCATEHSDLLGHCNRRTQTISVDTSQVADQLCDTLVHESLHAITDLVGLASEWDSDKEEAIVTRLSPAILGWLRANPKLVAYLTT